MKILSNFQTQIVANMQKTDYLTGHNLLANLHKLEKLKERNYSSFLVLSDTNVFNLYGEMVLSSLAKIGKPVIVSVIPPGEKYKTLLEIPKIIKPYFLGQFDKKACLVALGGGVITDLGGFISSLLLRGIASIYLPTTLLSQVDAAIGGKTGVDYQLGKIMLKNMIGTICQPQMVISDIDALSTLPQKEIVNGLGEIVKYWVGWGNPSITQLNSVASTPGVERSQLVEIISICQKIKVDIVCDDPSETKGLRYKLNLGHTVGHAVEGAANGRISHGEAVGIGLTAAARISVLKRLLTEDKYRMIISQMKSINLPTVARNISAQSVMSVLKLDKKGGSFVLIEDIGKLKTGIFVEERIINSVLKEVIID